MRARGCRVSHVENSFGEKKLITDSGPLKAHVSLTQSGEVFLHQPKQVLFCALSSSVFPHSCDKPTETPNWSQIIFVGVLLRRLRTNLFFKNVNFHPRAGLLLLQFDCLSLLLLGVFLFFSLSSTRCWFFHFWFIFRLRFVWNRFVLFFKRYFAAQVGSTVL